MAARQQNNGPSVEDYEKGLNAEDQVKFVALKKLMSEKDLNLFVRSKVTEAQKALVRKAREMATAMVTLGDPEAGTKDGKYAKQYNTLLDQADAIMEKAQIEANAAVGLKEK